MSIDPNTAAAVLELFRVGVKVTTQLASLAERARNGETIPIEEIKADREEVNSVVDAWDEACEEE